MRLSVASWSWPAKEFGPRVSFVTFVVSLIVVGNPRVVSCRRGTNAGSPYETVCTCCFGANGPVPAMPGSTICLEYRYAGTLVNCVAQLPGHIRLARPANMDPIL